MAAAPCGGAALGAALVRGGSCFAGTVIILWGGAPVKLKHTCLTDIFPLIYSNFLLDKRPYICYYIGGGKQKALPQTKEGYHMKNINMDWQFLSRDEFLTEYISNDGEWVKQIWWDGVTIIKSARNGRG